MDQIYGPASESVCRQFQSEKGLGVDGLVGPADVERDLDCAHHVREAG